MVLVKRLVLDVAGMVKYWHTVAIMIITQNKLVVKVTISPVLLALAVELTVVIVMVQVASNAHPVKVREK
ncbi:hypothetical protein OS42_43240 [Dickeya oryzae]